MKRYLKFLSLIVLLGSTAQAGWDQSTQRWEIDCNAGDSTACSFAAMGYEKGWVMVWDGKTNQEQKIKKNYVKAANWYKKGCELGNKNACASYKKLKNKVSTGYSAVTNNNKNYSIQRLGIYQTIYTILGKEKCFLFFDQEKKLQKSTCKKIVNSKGITIYCSPFKKVCKTEKEVREAI